ncbi:hypothetical protein EDE04_6841 [Streptomyces sp. 2132.2]|uniref:hypothetical protein n=1 Tax=Streptomyces sp. 2132.2 TaxID=2485161 RepID=UPI000F487A42|nr:hypothetical protein [Streptomyces sp. 2132.2]ROR00279.1 hypothetical protein EDE04_6841 [Streptomyces sp. 2132.2]
MGPARTTALATALLAAALPLAAPYAWAQEGRSPARPMSAAHTVTQVPGHPAIMYPGRQVTVVAYCPQGTKPTGGGAAVQDDPVSAVFIRESVPLDGNRWQVRAYNASAEVQTLHPQAICSTDPTLTYEVGPDKPLQPGESNNPSEANCGFGRTRFVVGGGIQAGDSTFANETSVGNGVWSAGAKYTNFDPDAPWSFVRATAVCSGTEATFRFSSPVRLAVGAVATVHVDCPAGLVPIGGGGDGSADVLLNSSAPTATGWTVRATNKGFSDRDSVFATVACAAP